MKRLFHYLLFSIATIAFVACGSSSNDESVSTDSTTNTTDVPATLLNGNGTTASVTKQADNDEKVISTVQVLTTEQFVEKVCDINNPKGFQYKGKLPAIVDFYADWCGPCRGIAPFLVELAKEYEGKIIIYKVNIDKCPEVASAFGVESIPTLLYLKPNAQPTATVGALKKEEIKKIIEDSLLK